MENNLDVNQLYLNELSAPREKILKIDKEIINLIGERMRTVSEVGEIKKKYSKESLDVTQWQKVLESRKQFAREAGLNECDIEEIWNLLHVMALKVEDVQ